jgi:uncharacterized protein YqeY
MREEINAALKQAMLAKDARRVGTLRMVNAAIKDRDIAERGQGRGPSGDPALAELLAKMIKQRQESARLYDEGKRPELAAQEREEIAIIEAFLPKQLGEEEMRAAIAEAVRETAAAGPKDMGKVMAALKARYAGQMDFSKASGLVKQALT